MPNDTSRLTEANFPARYRGLVRRYNADKDKLVACSQSIQMDIQSLTVREMEVTHAVTAEAVAASVRTASKLFEKLEWVSNQILRKADPTSFEVQRAALAKTSESVKSRWAAYFTDERGGVDDRSVKLAHALQRANDALHLGLELNQVAADYRQMRELGLLSVGSDDESYGALLTWQGTRFLLDRLGPWARTRRAVRRFFSSLIVQVISAISLVANVIQIASLFTGSGN